MKTVTLAVACLVLASDAFASSPTNSESESWRKWTQVGQAQLTVFLFDIYRSQLFTPSGHYALEQDISPHPLALSITYQRDISQQQLLDATLKQWAKLGYQKSKTSEWATKLETIFPDIEQGNNLTYVTDGSTGRFYYSHSEASQQLIGSIDEETFNDAFLAIWLSPETAYPQLRDGLIGRNQ
ncbi:periplasmic protein [Vibrio galatheae]|uniref:Periplasmic protein n=1 Tax=Vibrio galatheae TaxID=579748 RepID=A0A0F4NMA6_9VIBR|nr:chalcone isomerase family protein [Vibrio galatheae]KJY83216.1 periplasmic protein [Vibrio galatheae]